MRLTILVFLGLLHHVLPFEFSDAHQDGVDFGDLSQNIQTITVDENNNGERVTIAIVKDVKGEPTVDYYVDPKAKVLDVNFTGSGDKQFNLTVKRLDYEQLAPTSKSLLFDVKDGTDSTTVNVVIKNLDDESPTLTTSSCAMDELTDYTVDNTSCVFQISDPDGFLSQMDFSKIVGSKGESDLFKLEYKEIPDDTVQQSDVHLILQKQLNYDDSSLYSFHVEAKDGAGHSTIPFESVPITVQVNDIPNKPPVWTTFQSAKTITEKQATVIQVSAKDGDYGINNEINYKIDNDKPSGYVTINETNGLINITSIDRDAGIDELTFTVTAFEVPDPTSTLQGNILLIIEDVDDCPPKISIKGSNDKEININIDEGSTEINKEIEVSDLDQGKNAIYTATLTSEKAEFLEAFKIIPGKGYENTSLALTIIDPKKLDYENAEWITITMELRTEGTENKSMTDLLPITINLNDINDEVPVFQDGDKTVEIREDIRAEAVIEFMQATDKDAEDIAAGLKHKLPAAAASNILKIEPLGGNITTTKDDAFDYEKQREVFVQITATDLVNHTATAQLTIKVIDVNDENPKLVSTTAIEIDENQKDGTVLEAGITASDEDTTADLKFDIKWDKSYATKNSRRIADEDFKNYHCITVETISGETNHEASAKLTIMETVIDNTPDFEVFDNLYIYLEVLDQNTEKGTGVDSALIAITIHDLNDNSPIFSDNAKDKRQVVENSANGTVIGTITATDKDVGDNITYTIKPADDDTPNWIAIDNSGTISVHSEDGDIDCDDPVRYNITYTVTASDSVHETSIDITIDIKDQNDNIPTLEDQEKTIKEDNGLDTETNSNGLVVLELKPQDGDRDEPFHTVKCSFSSTTSSDVLNRFKIDDDNKIVVALSAGATLDREKNPEFNFDLRCIDDPTGQGPTSHPVDPPAKVRIVLEDVNDNYPTVITKEITGVSENTKAGPLSTKIQGEDLDDGDNGLMEFSIKKIERFLDPTFDNEKDVSQSLFDIETGENKKEATIILKEESLRDNYGYLRLTIETTDLGDPPLSSKSQVTVEVSKWNFEQPKFEFPEDGKTYYLKTTQNKDSKLKLWNDDLFNNLKATDQQNEKYSIRFKIVEDSSGANLFQAVDREGSQGELQLTTNTFTAQPYTVTINAYLDTDNTINPGEESYSKNCSFKIDFFDKDTTDPVFTNHEDVAKFYENSDEESYQVENATYPDVNIPNLDIFYLLREGDESIFSVDITTGLVSLKKQLDFEEKTSYDLVIQSSNTDKIKQNAINETKFFLTVEVQDVNDNLPVFEQKEYVSILISSSASTSSTVLTVSATDIDTTSQGQLQYSIKTIESYAPQISNTTAKNGFEIKNPKSGVITSALTLSGDEDGYFTLYLEVHDEDPEHIDTSTAQIYLVTAKHTVNFKFENSQQDVRNTSGSIKTILEAEFNYTTTVEDPKKDTTGDDDTDRTLVPVFFLNVESHQPIEATDILKQVTKVDKFQQLKAEFLKVGLLLMSFASDSDTKENLEETLKAWLIGVSVVLGALCLILLIAFILKTRALNQRIKKLSNTKFGSQESGLNRVGMAAPTTNKHAVEGSNPVYNNDVDPKDVDRNSVSSGDSDLIGVEDDEKFNFDNPKEKVIE